MDSNRAKLNVEASGESGCEAKMTIWVAWLVFFFVSAVHIKFVLYFLVGVIGFF